MSDSAVRVHTDPRISRRRKAVARSRRRRYFIGIALILGVVTLVYVMFWSPLLAVDEVKVVGARHTTSEEIATIAELDSGDNLLRLSTSAIAEKAEQLPWVKSAEVDRMLPGTVRVRVVERRPALVLSLASGRWTIDRSGVVLDEGEAAKGLPVLAGVEIGGVVPGDRLQTEESIDALKAYRSLPQRMRKNVAGVFAPTRERISFSLVGGTVVRFGAAERLEAKNEVLKALLARLREEGSSPAYIDVRVPTNPAVSLAQALSEEAATPVVSATPAPGASPSHSPSPSPSR
ncbi:MAG: cell division protein FtsQ [Actinomycetota bacterium]|nr:cell division protein FtsQ [Actinomycetota bacterium]